MSKLDTRVVQVSNIAASASKEQLRMLFQFIGRVRDIKVFPTEFHEFSSVQDQQVVSKVAYIEYDDATSAGVSLHLTNTVFIDRALMVVPVMDGKIPEDHLALTLTPQVVSHVNQGLPSWPTNVVSQLTGSGAGQVITTYDPKLASLSLPQYPPLSASLDAAKVEEVRRTVYIGNLDIETAGEVKYVRMAGKEGGRGAYLEFTDQRSVPGCLAYNGVSVAGRIITVQHARTAIVKPLSKSQQASKREVDDAMKKVKEAHSLISAAAGERGRSRSRSRRRSRSLSPSKKRSRSRSRDRRQRTRSRSRRRSRSTHRQRRSVSRSSRHRRSRSRPAVVVVPRERRRSRTRSPVRRRPSRPQHRSRSRERTHSRRNSRSRGRSKTPTRRQRTASRSPVKSRRRRGSASPSSARRRSPSPRKRRSPSPKKRRSKSRSPHRSAMKKKAHSPRRSRSGSRRRSKKDRKKERSDSLEHKEHERKKERRSMAREERDGRLPPVDYGEEKPYSDNEAVLPPRAADVMYGDQQSGLERGHLLDVEHSD